jgi:hypothetical protein
MWQTVRFVHHIHRLGGLMGFLQSLSARSRMQAAINIIENMNA